MLDLSQLPAAVRSEGGVSRRLVLAYGSALAALPFLADRTRGAERVSFPADPFALGVASGDPEPTGVVLWTRLAPKPLEPGGGMPAVPVEVRWEVADDEGMTKVVRSGTATATPDLGHSVHVEADGLRPDRWYFYRFRAGDAVSPVGRTRTAPAPDALPGRLRFAVASCQHYMAGYFTAYGHMAKDDLDLVVHLGDYIYEAGVPVPAVRQHLGGKPATLDEFRVRHAQYRSDPLLQGMHARCPWVITWDDHEVENNYADDTTPLMKNPVRFLRKRAAAYQAYYEMMPLRKGAVPRGPALTLYRTVPFGRLARFQVLDTRQYRNGGPAVERFAPLAKYSDPGRTMLGAKQAEWLRGELVRSDAAWNVLAQQVMVGAVDRVEGEGKEYAVDQWPGYLRERNELVGFLAARKVANPVVLTGDIHSNWVNDLRTDDLAPGGPVVATEFVGTSISSGGNGVDKPKELGAILAENPGVRFHNRERGYVRCDVTPAGWRTDFVVVPDVLKPGGPALTRASFAVESGRPGAKPA